MGQILRIFVIQVNTPRTFPQESFRMGWLRIGGEVPQLGGDLLEELVTTNLPCLSILQI